MIGERVLFKTGLTRARLIALGAAGLAPFIVSWGVSAEQSSPAHISVQTAPAPTYEQVHQQDIDSVLRQLGDKKDPCFDGQWQRTTDKVNRDQCAAMLRSATMALVYDPAGTDKQLVDTIKHSTEIGYEIMTGQQGHLTVTEIPMQANIAMNSYFRHCDELESTKSNAVLDATEDPRVNAADFVLSFDTQLSCPMGSLAVGAWSGESQLDINHRFMDAYGVKGDGKSFVSDSGIDPVLALEMNCNHEMGHTMLGLHHSGGITDIPGSPEAGNSFKTILDRIDADQYRDTSTTMGSKLVKTGDLRGDEPPKTLLSPYEIEEVNQLFGETEATPSRITLGTRGSEVTLSGVGTNSYAFLPMNIPISNSDNLHITYDGVAVNIYHPEPSSPEIVEVYLRGGYDGDSKSPLPELKIASIALGALKQNSVLFDNKQLPLILERQGSSVLVRRTT